MKQRIIIARQASDGPRGLLYCIGYYVKVCCCHTSVLRSMQMLLKPVGSKTRNFFQRSRFFKEMGCAGNNFQLLFTLQEVICFLIHVDYWIIETTHY